MVLILIIIIVIVLIKYSYLNKDKKSFPMDDEQIAYYSINKNIDMILNYQQEIASLKKNGSCSIWDGKVVRHSLGFTAEIIRGIEKDAEQVFIILLAIILKYFPNYPNGHIKLTSNAYENTIDIKNLLERRFKIEDWMKNILIEFIKSLAKELVQKSEKDDLDKQLSQVIKMAERIFQELQEESKE